MLSMLYINVLLPLHCCIENRWSHLDYLGANASCCSCGLQVHLRVVRLPSSEVWCWRRQIYKGAIPLKFSSSSPSMFSASSSSNHLSKPSYLVYILSVTYIKQSIICLKTSYSYTRHFAIILSCYAISCLAAYSITYSTMATFNDTSSLPIQLNPSP